ncbi:MAG: acetyltransferase [Fusobacteriaceae bacterium]
MEKVILIGAGGHARVLLDAALHDKNIEIVGFLDDGDIDEILGVKKLGNTSEIEKFRNYKFHIAIGNNSLREQLGAEIGPEKLVTIVHPTAYISRDVQIGRGCYIGANAVINSKAILEDMVIVNTKSVVEHDCILKKVAHLSYGVLLGSSVRVDEKVYIEMGSVVQRGIKVERDIR